jgi:hypothetical protein
MKYPCGKIAMTGDYVEVLDPEPIFDDMVPKFAVGERMVIREDCGAIRTHHDGYLMGWDSNRFRFLRRGDSIKLVKRVVRD